ncbi:MAG: hypothetical protein MUF08_00430 [Burkholderiaceae bacterium]|jgi:hypothetical protein|nr:hypothetical protein [Burkholderiaceae bacterium]
MPTRKLVTTVVDALPVRLAPRRGVELNPPCGGRWLRDADGGLSPADQETAAAAGLAWPAADDTEPTKD